MASASQNISGYSFYYCVYSDTLNCTLFAN